MNADRVTTSQAERLARLTARRPPGAGQEPDRPTVTTAHTATRRPVAAGSKRAALVMSLATTAGLSAWFAHVDARHAGAAPPVTDARAAVAPVGATHDTAATGPAPVPARPATVITASPVATTAAAATPRVTSTVPAAPTTGGTYTGRAVTIRYGTVQVAVTVADGKLTEVTTLSAPTGRSTRFTNAAVPVLTREALIAQSASIDAVSGATYTSQGYITSLQSAIDAAKAAGTLP